MKKFNLNNHIKVKLTDLGKDIYYHQFDGLLEALQARGIHKHLVKASFPDVDENGYSDFQLWNFIELYGPHIGLCKPNVIEDLYLYFEEATLADA